MVLVLLQACKRGLQARGLYHHPAKDQMSVQQRLSCTLPSGMDSVHNSHVELTILTVPQQMSGTNLQGVTAVQVYLTMFVIGELLLNPVGSCGTKGSADEDCIFASGALRKTRFT